MHAFIVMPIAFAAWAATMVGGLFAMALRDRLHLVLGFSAGAVIGLAFFDLLPEAIETEHLLDARGTVALSALGFFLYTMLDRVVTRAGPHDGHGHSSQQQRQRRGWMGAGSLSAHSLLDGFAIGVAFQASQAIGVVVAIAVLVHDFSDGLNTVNVVVKNGGNRKDALRWLVVDAVAPILGAGISLLLPFPEDAISIILAVFSGFFLYIGASDLLPESHHAHPRLFTTFATFLGAATLFLVTRIAQ
ncbi:MAG TPA: ZIP family metal transporter [Magnetospirillaceae bacterium]|nr:ZIP family metal transporter [Magnetospirillaceae bacterium]